jgi:hypothetical protein
MYKKKVTVFCLLPAYLLLVLHAVIPHHHHFSAENGPLSFHHGFNTQHHDHLAIDKHNDPDGHGHTAHFVHSPEFGTAMVRPGVKWIDISDQPGIAGIIEVVHMTNRDIILDAQQFRFPESPPLYLSPITSAITLRGPPVLAIA